MTAIIPFDFSAPANRGSRRPNSINSEAIINAAGFPVISIKGKTFALVKDGERRVLTRVIDDEEVPVSSMQLAVVRANAKARVFYAKGYVEGDSEGAKPTCFSHDGDTPDSQVESPQSTKCAACLHAVWGSKVSQDGQTGKGTACTVNTRLAVTDPKNPDTVFLLRVPAASRTNFSDAVKIADGHGKDYNEVVMRISFDPDAPSPKLIFKPQGLLSDEVYEKVRAKYDDQMVQDIVGVPTVRAATVVPAAALPAPTRAPLAQLSDDELDSALSVSAPAPAPVAKPRAAAKPPAPAPAPAPEVAAEPAADAGAGELLTQLNSLLGANDD